MCPVSCAVVPYRSLFVFDPPPIKQDGQVAIRGERRRGEVPRDQPLHLAAPAGLHLPRWHFRFRIHTLREPSFATPKLNMLGNMIDWNPTARIGPHRAMATQDHGSSAQASLHKTAMTSKYPALIRPQKWCTRKASCPSFHPSRTRQILLGFGREARNPPANRNSHQKTPMNFRPTSEIPSHAEQEIGMLSRIDR